VASNDVEIRRAALDDVGFLVELMSNEEVEPFLGAVMARDRAAVAAEVARSLAEPHDFGRFVIDVAGASAGAMGFELANRRSRIAHLERLAVHPSFRGRRIADAAARLLQDHLFRDLGYHRLQLEIYGFNERAQRHAERAGFVREGARRSAYWRHGAWVEGVMYGLVAEEANLPSRIRLLHDYIGVHNECVRLGRWDALRDWFAEDAELAFDGVPLGPFRGVDSIVAGYEAHPPDDQVLTFAVDEEDDRVVARYGWLKEPAVAAGRMVLTGPGGRIGALLVTFEDGLEPVRAPRSARRGSRPDRGRT
jgi:RimJ/RimL family protein N-acetyltransferase